MTAVSVDTADKLNHIRRELQDAGVVGKPEAMQHIAAVLEHVGDADLTVAALLMTPRPGWLWELVGYDLALPLAPAAPPVDLAAPRAIED